MTIETPKLPAAIASPTLYPRIPDLPATAYVAATMLIMAYSALFSVVPILVFFTIWLPHIFYKRVFMLKFSWDLGVILLLPLLASYSAFWSDYPGKTIHTGLELASMVICITLMIRLISIEALIKGLIAGSTIALAISLWSARHNINDGDALVGLFGSKNALGFVAEIGFSLSLLAMFSRRSWLERGAYGLAPFLICAECLRLSKSSSSVLSLGVMFAVVGGAWLLTRIPKPQRFVALALGLLAVPMIVLFLNAANFNIADKVLEHLGKDSTLTGRTYLWSEGVRIGLERPLLGHGYSAFWVVGQPLAEKYWQMFGIDSKTGFHFHNLFIQSFVDLGTSGLLIVVFMLLLNLGKSLWSVAQNGMRLDYTYALAMSVIFFVRAFVEVDWLGPFGVGELIFFTILPVLRGFSEVRDNVRA